jgi:hypothetical protein
VLAVLGGAAYALADGRVRLPWLVQHVRIGTIRSSVGSMYILTGTTPHRMNGSVRVTGSWDVGPSEPFASVSTVGGRYVVRFKLQQAGTLRLRVIYPGGDAKGLVIVAPRSVAPGGR